MEARLGSALILRKEYARERGPITWFNLQSIFSSLALSKILCVSRD
jgi:hypothetical protein